MTDSFEALRSPLTPVDPDPAFAAALRVRLQRALLLLRGVSTSSTPESAPAPARPAMRRISPSPTAVARWPGTPKRSAPVRTESRS